MIEGKPWNDDLHGDIFGIRRELLELEVPRKTSHGDEHDGDDET
jgi:hypothetical protein